MQLETVRPLVAFIGLLASLCCGSAFAQSLMVVPVNIQMAPNQMATALTLINQGDTETSMQVRVLRWTQPGAEEELTPSSEMRVSPPIVTIAPGATQIVRLVLRNRPQGREETYRILLDQIPVAAAPGTVRIALRLSIPVFASPATRVASLMKYFVENRDGKAALVAVNDGDCHETIRDVTLTSETGDGLNTVAVASPYILAGATRRWAIAEPAHVPPPGQTLRLTARNDGGAVDRIVTVMAGP